MLYGMKTKDDAIKALRTWYADTADLRTKHRVVVLMRDNASEYKSEEMMQFLESKGIRSHFSTPKEQWQNGAAESTINSIMMSARTVMAESGLGDRFGSKQQMPERTPEVLPIRNASESLRTKPCMVKRMTFQTLGHSPAGLGYIWTSSAEKKESTRQEPKRQYMSVSPTI